MVVDIAVAHKGMPAAKGLAAAIATDPGLGSGLQLHRGQVTCARLAQDTKRPSHPFKAAAGGCT